MVLVSVFLMEGGAVDGDGMGYSRHESSGHSLEEQCDGAGSARKKTSDAAAKGDETEEKGADGEEETDEDEGEHESGFEVVFLSSVQRSTGQRHP